jgi:thiol-disulfide isomerase/thioredoxin
MALGKTRRGVLAALAAAAALTFGIGGAAPALAAGDPPLEGNFGARFMLKDDPQPAPDVAFTDRDGARVRLADFKGRVVLVNFWATWCAPCVEEMPTLDALQADLGSDAFTVLAVSEDMGGLETVEPFLRDKLDLQTLDIYLDDKGALAQAFGVRGMPTTYLIDASGRVVGGLEGPANWNGAPVKKLIRHYIDAGRASGVINTSG